MRVLVVVVALVAVVVAEDDFCYKSTHDFCSKKGGDLACNAQYGGITSIVSDLQRYVNKHISSSFDYLLLSTHFGNFEKERRGFEKLYRSLSDQKWNAAIDLIKHITKRGEKMNFGERDLPTGTGRIYELSELESLAKALEIEKSLATRAIHIHKEITRKAEKFHDGEISHYLEEEFMEKQADTVRDLSGHANDLSKLLSDNLSDNSISLFLFDEYLQKL